jgi:hypothetical protein
MRFEDVIEKSIKSFLNGKLPEELEKVQGESIVYTPVYMDELEEELNDMEPEVEEDVDAK